VLLKQKLVTAVYALGYELLHFLFAKLLVGALKDELPEDSLAQLPKLLHWVELRGIDRSKDQLDVLLGRLSSHLWTVVHSQVVEIEPVPRFCVELNLLSCLLKEINHVLYLD
jgi:hypothetical protein